MDGSADARIRATTAEIAGGGEHVMDEADINEGHVVLARVPSLHGWVHEILACIVRHPLERRPLA